MTRIPCILLSLILSCGLWPVDSAAAATGPFGGTYEYVHPGWRGVLLVEHSGPGIQFRLTTESEPFRCEMAGFAGPEGPGFAHVDGASGAVLSFRFFASNAQLELRGPLPAGCVGAANLAGIYIVVERDLRLDRETISTAQYRLNQRGLQVGSIDGVVGPQTRQAVRAFQRDRGLTETGALTLETLAALTDARVIPDPDPGRTAVAESEPPGGQVPEQTVAEQSETGQTDTGQTDTGPGDLPSETSPSTARAAHLPAITITTQTPEDGSEAANPPDDTEQVVSPSPARAGSTALAWLTTVPDTLTGTMDRLYGDDVAPAQIDPSNPPFEIAITDLDENEGSGPLEILVFWNDEAFCTEAGCRIDVLRNEGRGYATVLRKRARTVSLGERHTQGLRDIVLDDYRIFRWTGLGYAVAG